MNASKLGLLAFTALLLHPFCTTAAVLSPSVRTVLDSQCMDCHDSDAKKGGLDLTGIKPAFDDPKSLSAWIRIHDRVHDGEMPPPKRKERPDPAAVKSFTTELGRQISDYVGQRQSELGRVRGRRLNRAEYESTLHDLLGVPVPLAAMLPEDPKAGGFENQAEAQSLSPVLIEKYVDAADLALQSAFDMVLRPAPKSIRRFGVDQLKAESPKFYGYGPTPRSGDVIIWNYKRGPAEFYGRLPRTHVYGTGRFRIRVRASAVSARGGNLQALLSYGKFEYSSPGNQHLGILDLRDEPSEFEFVAWLEGDGMLCLRPEDNTPGRCISSIYPMNFADRINNLKAGDLGAAVEWIQIERLPNGPDPLQTRQRLFGDLEVQPGTTRRESAHVIAKAPEQDLARLMHSFAAAAFRRPVTDDDVAEYVAFAQDSLRSGNTFEQALLAGYRALLASPRFLYFQERAGTLDDYALASRLSYFLTGSMPDPTLRHAAKTGRLHDPAELRAQTQRLLDGEGAGAFSERFAEQWLKLDEINFTQPDAMLYPEFDLVLQASMLGETRAFLAELLRSDLSVVNLVKSDFAMLNERMARFYGLDGGIDGPKGMEFHKVALAPDSPRGGLLAQASVLKVTANGTTTSPVLRGVWVRERLLGLPVPPPPANVPAVEPDIRGAQTIREQLDKHRTLESCAACHAKIDPPGFALENFDVIGGWRDTYRKVTYRQVNGVQRSRGWQPGLPVDAHGQLPDGRSFTDIRSYRDLIASDPDLLARNLAVKLVTYATGAGISFADRAQIDTIVQHAKDKDYGVRTLLLEVIQSPLFTRK